MRRLLEFLQDLNRPCRDMTALISASFDQQLPWSKRFAYRLHILYCTSCRRYRQQLGALRRGLRAMGTALRREEPGPGPKLADSARQRITDALQKP
ncbi:MAG: hypothetical protein PVJ57_16250 [Phycisphaerae bacterium]|jgi:hypothetical protein